MIEVIDSFLPRWRYWLAGLVAVGAVASLTHACDLELAPDAAPASPSP